MNDKQNKMQDSSVPFCFDKVLKKIFKEGCSFNINLIDSAPIIF